MLILILLDRYHASHPFKTNKEDITNKKNQIIYFLAGFLNATLYSFIYYNTKQPHNDYTIFAIGKKS